MAPSSHYQVLGVAPSCSSDELRRAYHRAARRSHPDKANAPPIDVISNNSSIINSNSGELWQENDEDGEFLRVQQAYEVLRDVEQRAAYDKELARKAAQLDREQQGVVVSDEVSIESMKREELEEDDGEQVVVFSHACRCGDAFEVTQEELDDGVRIVPCCGCSQHIRVLA